MLYEYQLVNIYHSRNNEKRKTKKKKNRIYACLNTHNNDNEMTNSQMTLFIESFTQPKKKQR